MRKIAFVLILLMFACKAKQEAVTEQATNDLTNSSNEVIKIAFGSCNKHDTENVFWDDIVKYNPDLWIWGGDIVYADTDDIVELKEIYDAQDAVVDYAKLKEAIPITGVWDDHDYGLNDGGEEFEAKEGSQQAFLDFMDVGMNDARRAREGTYSTKTLRNSNGSVKIINLDTRYFRSTLKESEIKGRRYDPDTTSTKTILGDAQWRWLEKELKTSSADFNLIVSSIQFLSNEHGFEKWYNMPNEVEKMKLLIIESNAKGVVFLSGDRHISEFSKTDLEGAAYPLIDFTSSGLTHSYSSFKGEPNPYRIGDVVSSISYGTIELNIKTGAVTFRIMGDNTEVLQELKQTY